MIINLLLNHWVIVQGREPLLFTASKSRDFAIKKWEKSKGMKWTKKNNRGGRVVNVDISVKDLSLKD